MITARTQAKDLMLTLVKSVTDAQSLSVAWEDVDTNTTDQIPDAGTKWCRVSVRHRAGEAVSLSSPSGKRKHHETGFLLVEVFTPCGDGSVANDTIVQAFMTALRTRSSLNQLVWYTGVRGQEQGQVDGWYKTNVVAEFHYHMNE